VTVDPRGAVIIADDLANTIWRVSRVGGAAVPATPAAPADAAAPGSDGAPVQDAPTQEEDTAVQQ
jgi:hypothetical protein